MNYVDEEIPKHRKKSQAHPPAKAKHKHIFEPCIIEYPKDWYVKSHLQSGEKQAEFYGYCTVCGKIGDVDRSMWLAEEQGYHGPYIVGTLIPTEEGVKELDPVTRTLPTFTSNTPFAKSVKID